MAPTNIITTGHDASGNSIFIAGHEPKVFSPYVNVIYSSDGSPLNLNSNSDIAAFAARDFSSKLFPTEGSVVVTAEWPPLSDGRADKMHRTLSVDIGVMLCGESKLFCFYFAFIIKGFCFSGVRIRKGTE